jgi:uncharacterized protein YidB (DUF937 family)
MRLNFISEIIMGLLDSAISAISGNKSQPHAQGQASLLPALIEYVNNYPGGLSGLIAKFQQGGLGEVVTSWVGTGQNQPVSPEQLQSALGDDTVDHLAESSGQDRASVLTNLSALLPTVVDHATPSGEVQQNQGLDAASLMSSLSGILGKL